MIIERAVRPFRFAATPADAVACGVGKRSLDARTARESVVPLVPGVLIRDDGIWCARDVVEVVGGLLGTPVQPHEVAPWDTVTAEDWPGIADYERLFAPKLWPHQPAGAAFLAKRSSAFECDPCRTGKNVQVIAASILVGARHVLIATMGTPKLGWAEDVAKWLGEPALVLEGRAGDDGWMFCVPCAGRGIIDDRGKLIKCAPCKGRGWTHPIGGVNEALQYSRFVIANYDIMIGQKVRDRAGAISVRDDLRGFLPEFRRVKFDTVVADEIHKVGGKGWRRQALADVTRKAKRVWAPTATPTDGRMIKLWSPLDIVTGGMFGRSPKKFAVRYAGGFEGHYGFTIPKSGMSPLAAIELPHRLQHLMIRREREVITPHLPKIRRDIIRVRVPKNETYLQADKSAEALARALDATSKIKIPIVVENALAHLEEGLKITVYSRLRNTGFEIHELLQKEIRKSKALQARNTIGWCCIGKSTDTRVNMATAYSEHNAGGYFSATIDGFQTGRSLVGVAFNHYPDLHWEADSIRQTEERSLLYDRLTGLVSLFYVVLESSDDNLISVLIPKLESLEAVFGDKNAGEFRDLLSPKETLEETWKRHTAHLRAA